MQEGDRISVYPVFEALDITPLVRLRPHPLRTLRFVLDNHLGKLAGYLRLLGFGTLYYNDYTDTDLARLSSNDSSTESCTPLNLKHRKTTPLT